MTFFLVFVALLLVAALSVVIFLWIQNERDQTDRFTDSLLNTKHKKSVSRKRGLDKIEIRNQVFGQVIEQLHTRIVGSESLINGILICLLTGSHALIEGVPGLAKTKTIKTLSEIVDLDFKRIQFTPDLLPSDIVGIEMLNMKTQNFETKVGPVMAHIVLADEINRATPKVQSALLEAMQEHQITINGVTHPLPQPFLVLATQNPLEHEGTYPLPEAQLDRFLFKLGTDYPSVEQEQNILSLSNTEHKIKIKKILTHSLLKKAQEEVENIKISEDLKRFIVECVHMSRDSSSILVGSSPRGSLSIMKAAQAVAYLENRDSVSKSDVMQILLEALRHRIILSPQARGE
jgi:MoxR-like ATPase